jgi:hypothetical protein
MQEIKKDDRVYFRFQLQREIFQQDPDHPEVITMYLYFLARFLLGVQLFFTCFSAGWKPAPSARS